MQEYIVRVYEDRTEWRNKSGKYHRIDGPAFERADGRVEYWIDGKLHRIDGPAYEWPVGDKAWYQDGKLHRLDGPACEYASGNKEWYIDGVEYTEKEFLAKTQTKELTVAEIEKLLGYSVKIVANKI